MMHSPDEFDAYRQWHTHSLRLAHPNLNIRSDEIDSEVEELLLQRFHYGQDIDGVVGETEEAGDGLSLIHI